jgi:hypothetical protein
MEQSCTNAVAQYPSFTDRQIGNFIKLILQKNQEKIYLKKRSRIKEKKRR